MRLIPSSCPSTLVQAVTTTHLMGAASILSCIYGSNPALVRNNPSLSLRGVRNIDWLATTELALIDRAKVILRRFLNYFSVILTNLALLFLAGIALFIA